MVFDQITQVFYEVISSDRVINIRHVLILILTFFFTRHFQLLPTGVPRLALTTHVFLLCWQLALPALYFFLSQTFQSLLDSSSGGRNFWRGGTAMWDMTTMVCKTYTSSQLWHIRKAV